MADEQTPIGGILASMNTAMQAEIARLQASETTLDIAFCAYLRQASRFGFFTFGPINIDVSLIEDIVARQVVRRAPGQPADFVPPMSDDYVRFSTGLMNEVRRSGRSRIDELHFLLAFMRCNEGLPKSVFSELGISPEQVEEFARTRVVKVAELEKLYSPEEVAAYLNVHVQTVRAWIRSGRLRARRLAGQRALRITASDLQSLLEPLDLDAEEDL